MTKRKNILNSVLITAGTQRLWRNNLTLTLEDGERLCRSICLLAHSRKVAGYSHHTSSGQNRDKSQWWWVTGWEGAEETVLVDSTGGDPHWAALELSALHLPFQTAQGRIWSQQPSYPALFHQPRIFHDCHRYCFWKKKIFKKACSEFPPLDNHGHPGHEISLNAVRILKSLSLSQKHFMGISLCILSLQSCLGSLNRSQQHR